MGICARYHRNEVPDEAWADFYLRLLASGRERVAMYNLPRPTPEGFVRMIRQAEGPYFLLTWDGEIAGGVHLDGISGKSANVHFAFIPLPALRHKNGLSAPVALARFALAEMLYDRFQDGTHVHDVLIAKHPVWNRRTSKLLFHIGAVVLGEIPFSCHCHDSGRDSAGVVSYFTRDTVRPEWARY